VWRVQRSRRVWHEKYFELAAVQGFSAGAAQYALTGSGSGPARGVIGYNLNEFGVVGANQNGNGWAGGFFNVQAVGPNSGKPGLYVQGDFVVQKGTKSAGVKTEQFGYRKMYAVEATENVFEDFGTATLRHGRARVELDAIFAATVDTGQPYQVFLTARADTKGLYVSDWDAHGFTVQEAQGGTGSYAVDYRVVAKVRGYASVRMEAFTPPTLPRPPAPPGPIHPPGPSERRRGQGP
jgi:hypothetical protein